MVKKVLSTVAQWERHAVRLCTWKMAGFGAPKGEADLGLGWWELPEHENYPVGVADATAAMIHAIQFGGAMEFGGSIRDLTVFVREYVQSCRLTCAIKRYTHEEKKEKMQCQQLLRTAFDEAEESRANFEEQARVITSKLTKRHAESKTFDALHILALQRAKNFDLHMENCRQISEGWLALQNVHSYQALSRLYPRLAAIEKEMEDTIRSMTELTNPGAADLETDLIEEEEPKKDEHPKKRAQRRRETMRKRRQAMERKMSPNPESQTSAPPRPQISFEDKEAHDDQLADLRKRFKKISDDVELNIDAADRGRLQHLMVLLTTGQQKMQEHVDGLAKTEADATKYELTVFEKLRSKYEKWALESLKRGRVPTEMDPGALRRGAGPTPQERDELRRRNANLRMDIEERMMIAEEERELQDELNEVLEKLQEITGVSSTGGPGVSSSVEEDVALPALVPVLKALDHSMQYGASAQEMAHLEFVQLTTTSAKIERTARNLGKTISKLVEGQISKPEAQETEWKGACKDLILDMEQVLDQIKVHGLPKSIVDKFWQAKQLEIKAAQQSVEDANDKRAKKAQRERKKEELKLEQAIQEQENKKKQLLLSIEALWARTQKGEDKPSTPRGPKGNAGPPAPAPAAVVPGSRPTARNSALGPAGAVMERILQSHRADIANGHLRRKGILEDIWKLQEQIKEAEPVETVDDTGGDEEAAAGEVHDTGSNAEEELTVDWLGLNRVKDDAAQASSHGSPAASGRSTPSGTAMPGAAPGHEGGEPIEEESSSSSATEEERPVLQMDPWILAFPFDPPDLAKKKFEFCEQHRIKTHRLHEPGKQKKYQFLLRRIIKQEKRTLMLKQKLLLKFLTGDELQRAKNEMKKGPADLKAEAEVERGKLKDRQMMIAKLLNFWQRRMKTLEDDADAEREAFRMKVKALLEDIHSLAVVLESAAMSKKRRRRIEAEDLLRLRRQKAEEAARQQVEEERESMNTNQALKAARETEGQGSMTALQKMAAFAHSMAGGDKPQDDAAERMRLAKMLRTFMDQNKEQRAGASSEPSEAASPAGLFPPSRRRRPSVGRRPSQRRSTETQDEDLTISATQFHRQRSPPDSTAVGAEEVPTQTLSLEDRDGEGKATRSSSILKGFGVSSSSSRQGRRVTAKRKPSVAQRDSIFANPAAMSRRITGDAAATRAATIEVTLGGVGNTEAPKDPKEPKAASPSLPKDTAGSAGADAGSESLGTPLMAETWSLGDVPRSFGLGGSSPFGGLKGKVKTKGKENQGRLSLHRPSSRSSSPEGVRRPSTVRKPQRPSKDYGPPHDASQVVLSVGSFSETRETAAGGSLQVKTPDRRPGRSPSNLSRPGSAEDTSPLSRRGSEREVDPEEVRAEMFLKATYMHLGTTRVHQTHPALRTQKPALSDALFCANGERLFRGLVTQIMDLPPETALKVVRNISNTERGRCLFIIKNSLIHQARIELEASQRVIHILEQDVDEVKRQLAEGGPLFPLSGKPVSETSSSASSGSEANEDGDASPSSPKRNSKEVKEPTSPQRVKSRRAGMRGLLAFSEMARSGSRRPTVAVSGEVQEEAPLLQIRSADASNLPLPVSNVEARPTSASRKRGSKSLGQKYLAPANTAERLREAQLAADATDATRKESQTSDKPSVPTVFTSSLASAMLKNMLKKNTAAPEVRQKSALSLLDDYAWDQMVDKLDGSLRKHNFDPDLSAGQWKSHFAWDLLNDDPLSSRLPQDRPRSAPPPHVKQLLPHQRKSIWSMAVARPPVVQGESASGAATEAEQDENKPTSATGLFALAKFMSRMKNKKPSQVDNFFYVHAMKEKWQQRFSRPKLLTPGMEEDYRAVRDKLIQEKGIWLQRSRRKVEQMELHLDDEVDLAGGFDRQQRNLRERGVAQQEQKGFDSLSFVRWKVDKQLKQAMQDSERGTRVGPVTRQRTAGPPPHEPVEIAGDKRYNNNLEASKQRIASIRAKKSKDPRFVKQGRGRSWRVALDVFEYLDQKIANPDDWSESESESETDSNPFSRSHSTTSFTPEPGHFRRGRRRRTSKISSKKVRELSVLSPWMRSQFMSDEEYDQRPDNWDLRCWLQPVRHRARTATDRVFTPEAHWKALSRKGSRSDPGRRHQEEDPQLLVQQACRQLVEDFEKAEDAPVPSVNIVEADAEEDAKHSKVLEILEQDSLLNQEPLDLIEEEEEDSGNSGTEQPVAATTTGAKGNDAKESGKMEVTKSLPMLSTQTLMFDIPSLPSSKPKTGTPVRGAMAASSSVPSLRSDSSKGSLHAAPRHGPALAPHAVRVAAERRRQAPADPKRSRNRRSSRFEMFHLVARPQDLRQTAERRRSLVRAASPSHRSNHSSRRPTEVAPAHQQAPKMTVNIGKLSKELAKRWTNVTSQEVEHRRIEMERLKEEEGEVNLDSFFEYHHFMRTATDQSEGGLRGVRRPSVPSVQVGDQRMPSRSLGSKGTTLPAPEATTAAAAGAAAASAAQAAQLKVQKHLAQLRSWRAQGKPPSSPVPLPVLVPKEHKEPRAATKVREEKPKTAEKGESEIPMAAVDSATEYMKGFKDADLNRLLEEISQTDTFPEGEDFVWPPKAKVPLPKLSRGESYIKAIVRGDSPHLDPDITPRRRGQSPEAR